MRRVLLLLLAALLLCSFASCNQKSFNAGEPLTAEELEALKNQLAEEEEEEEEEPFDGTVYWLSSGSVYHKKKSCYHIKDKENVQSGTEEDALAAGKKSACKSCG